MATPQGNYRRSATRRAKPEPAPRPSRGKEVLGFLIIALAVLLAIAIVTYSSADYEAIAEDTPFELVAPQHGQQVNNALGPVGAWLAHFIVPSFFGYVSLFLTIVLAVWGYIVLRRRSLSAVLLPTLIGVIAMAYAAILIARIDMSVASDLDMWSGRLGVGAAEWLEGVTGWLGSYLILGIVLIVGLMLGIDRDIQRSLDRVERMFRSAKSTMHARKNAVRDTLKAAEKAERGKEQTTWADLDRDKADTEQPRDDDSSDAVEDRSRPKRKTKTSDAAELGDLELSVVGQVHEETTREVKSGKAIKEAGYKYKFPSIDLLDAPDARAQHIDYDELEENKRILLDKLAVYKIEITDINAVVGPTVTLYELTPAPGVKISRIKSLENDLAMAMAARGIRMIAPIPGKTAVGVEIPNRRRELVRVRSIIGTKRFRDASMALPVALGKTIEGEVYLQDLASMPHLLIAGATGSGKSVGLNTLIAGLLYSCRPANLKFVMIDPKKIELQQYRDLTHHYLAIPEDGDDAIITDVEDALGVLRGCEREMAERYDLLQDARVRSIGDYNRAFEEGQLDEDKGHKHLPYIVVIIDELADLMMTAGKDIEAPIARLAQMARAIGIHLVLATQRPSVDVITGLIKANFPSRVAFQVASKIDARTILDQNGAEQLVGNGDMLYMSGSKLMRLQGPFVSVSEIDRLMAFIRAQPGPGPYILPSVEDEPQMTIGGAATGEDGESTDELFEEAARIIVRSQQGSVSLIQRKLSIGYTRAARIVDQLEHMGIVGPFVGAKARDVLVPDEMALEKLLRS